MSRRETLSAPRRRPRCMSPLGMTSPATATTPRRATASPLPARRPTPIQPSPRRREPASSPARGSVRKNASPIPPTSQLAAGRTYLTLGQNATSSAQAGTPCAFIGTSTGTPPLWSPTNWVAGQRPISFASLQNAVTNSYATNFSLTINSGLSWTYGKDVAIYVGQPLANHSNQRYAFYLSGGTYGYLWNYPTNSVADECATGTGICTTLAPEDTPSVSLFVNQGTGIQGTTGGQLSATANNAVASHSLGTTQATTGGIIGANTTTNAMTYDALAFILYTRSRPEITNSAMSTADMLSRETSSDQLFQHCPSSITMLLLWKATAIRWAKEVLSATAARATHCLTSVVRCEFITMRFLAGHWQASIPT